MTKTKNSVRNLIVPTNDASTFAKGQTKRRTNAKTGVVLERDVRLTVNIREDLRVKLKVRAAWERTTVGDLIERWIESWK